MIPTDNQPQKNKPVKKKWAKPEIFLLDSGDINGGTNSLVLEKTGHGSNQTPNNHAKQPAIISWFNTANNLHVANWTDAHS